MNEQEASVLRKKVEELEAENERLKSNAKELQDKLIAKSTHRKNVVSSDRGSTLHDKKLKVNERELPEGGDVAFLFF